MTVFSKTQKGIDEIERRTLSLDPKLRRLLIMVDGKKEEDDLKNILGNDVVGEGIQHLLMFNYIEVLGEIDPSAEVSQLPEKRPADALEKAKNYMVNTLSHFHGQYNKLDLMRAVKECANHQELRGLYPDWLRCMSEARLAVKRIPELKKELFNVL